MSQRSFSDAGSQASVKASPFKLPTDEEVFITREAERMRKDEEKERARHMKIWEKQTACTGNQLTRPKDQDIPAEDIKGEIGYANYRNAASRDIISKALGVVNNRKSQKQVTSKENTRDYVEQKKEMFLVEMSNRILKQEIEKINSRCDAKKDALDKSHNMLERDHKGFNDHMERNQKATNDAIDRANKEAVEKKNKEQDIKLKEQEKSTITAEITRNIDMLEGLTKYKTFLDELTPEEWFAEQAAEEAKQKEACKQSWINEQLNKDDSDSLADENASQVSSGTANSRQRARIASRGKKGESRRSSELSNKFDQLVETGQLEVEVETKMFFDDPKQLLNIFKDIEDDNLFLIELQQDLESENEKIKSEFQNIALLCDAKYKELEENKNHLDGESAKMDAKIANINSRFDADGVEETYKAEQTLKTQLTQFYGQLEEGYDTEAGLNSLDMLKTVEAKITKQLEVLAAVGKTDPEKLNQKEKAMEKLRREKRNKKFIEEEQRLLAERKDAANARMKAPIKKHTGRPVMKKALIPKKVKAKKVKAVIKTEDELIRDFIEETS